MKNTNITKSHFVTDEVKVNLDMLGTLVLDGVWRHINNTDIVTIYQCGPAQGSVQLRAKLTNPSGFSNCICNSTILRLGTRAGDRILTLGWPGDEVVTKKNNISWVGSAGIWATSLIGIGVYNYLVLSRGTQWEAQV
jgi:hypothetical protein